jgi:hypothetical protein
MKLYDKVKWILGILMIVTLVITTNLVDRNNFLKVTNAVETIYEDRLVAKDLIFKASDLIHKKEIAAIKANASFYSTQNDQVNQELENLLFRYDQTKLTPEEKSLWSSFKSNLNELLQVEKDYIQSNFGENSALLTKFPDVKNNLRKLASIQLEEGSRQLKISRRAIDTIELFTQIEIYILIFLAIIVQIIVMYKPKED